MKRKKLLTKSDIWILVACLFIVLLIGLGSFWLLQNHRNEQKAIQVAEEEAAKKEAAQKQKSPEEKKMEEIDRRLRQNDTEGLKVVFLTFDDGPSIHSEGVLDILKQYNVKATFFSLGVEKDLAKKIWDRILQEGHTLANHSSTHNYSLYDDPDSFYEDVETQANFQENITGKTKSGLFRFPGGSATANETCCRGIVERGYNYVDWNVSSGDANPEPLNPDQIEANTINGCAQFDVSVVLFHAEVNENTRIALPHIIETLKEQGYTLMPMKKEYTYPRQIEV